MFPQFNIHSTPLLILVIQGLIFAVLLFRRFMKEGQSADLVMACILIVMAYHRTTYTIGFMGWYDTFTNTKINYFLFSFYLALGPLIYLYVRTTLVAPFRLERHDGWHFIPMAVYVLYRLFMLLYDIQQEDWHQGYEGYLLRELHSPFLDPLVTILEYSSQLVYYAFTIQLFIRYRKLIKEYFSNTYQVEYNWIRNFLIVYSFLFVYAYLTDLIDSFVVDLDYVHRWWVHFFSAIAIVYLGIKAYFTDLSRLHNMTFELGSAARTYSVPKNRLDFSRQRTAIVNYLEGEQAYLNPQITLGDLASGVGLSVNEVSAIINDEFGVNFNEWINRYRVSAVKEKLMDPSTDHLSLVAIGFDCGFNSKATFNRVFKQITGVSPSQYKADQLK